MESPVKIKLSDEQLLALEVAVRSCLRAGIVAEQIHEAVEVMADDYRRDGMEP